MRPNIDFFFLEIIFTLSPLPGIFRYSNLDNCPDVIVPYSGFTGLKNTLGLVSLFNGISTFVGYLMPKPFS